MQFRMVVAYGFFPVDSLRLSHTRAPKRLFSLLGRNLPVVFHCDFMSINITFRAVVAMSYVFYGGDVFL